VALGETLICIGGVVTGGGCKKSRRIYSISQLWDQSQFIFETSESPGYSLLTAEPHRALI
jgi:hypothetical protein